MQIVPLTTAIDHRYRHPAIRILKPLNQIVIFVIDRQQCGEVLPEILLGDRAVNLFCDAALGLSLSPGI
jgi:nucleoside-triphosphatase THEP1